MSSVRAIAISVHQVHVFHLISYVLIPPCDIADSSSFSVLYILLLKRFSSIIKRL